MLATGAVVTMIVAPLVMLSDAPSIAGSAVAAPAQQASNASANPAVSSAAPRVLTLRQIQLTDARVVEHRHAAQKAAARAQAAANARAQADQAAQLAAASARAAAIAQAAATARASVPVVHHVAVHHPVVPSGGANSRTGLATYYYWHSGQCASPWLPHGTTVTIRDNATGKTTSCVVTDPSVFTQLAPLGQGVIGVTISW
jgi:hypothetical protein